ncbi:anti-sigma factor domain-containing protein [Vallitalea guaymasensis]|uniref:anti-sigma factor domain-containing protein n=1 Tax=Vallitalea guaymasensis TaxID=1185412 RepID=UPI002355CBBA|nr:anti-sigma factor domain-containing protein [Vallitalea guaymasensis]
MRAVVMEIYSNHIIVLTKDGQFKKMKKPNHYIEVGMEINIDSMTNTNYRRIAAIIAIVFLISGFGVSAYAYYTPYGYVNVDINPSIEIVYNRFNRILKINGVNEDGKNVVDNISDYKNKKVEKFLGDIIAENTLNNSDQVNVILTYDKLEEEAIDNLKQSIEENDKVNVYAFEIPKNEYEKIKCDNLSPGKAALIDKIKTSNPSYKEKLEEKTIEELVEIVDKRNNKYKENNSNKDNNKKNNNGNKKNDNGSDNGNKNNNSGNSNGNKNNNNGSSNGNKNNNDGSSNGNKTINNGSNNGNKNNANGSSNSNKNNDNNISDNSDRNNNGNKNNNGTKLNSNNTKETSSKNIIDQKEESKVENKQQKHVKEEISNDKKTQDDIKGNKDQGKHIGQSQNNKKNNDSIKGNGNTHNKNKNKK